MSYAYSCVENGVAHWSNVLEFRLPMESTALEVFHVPPYSSFKVPLPTDLTVRPTGDAAVDWAWQVRFDTAGPQDADRTRAVVSCLGEAPERFSLRVHGRTLVVWRDGGFDSASSAEACTSAALAAVAAFHADVPVLAAV
jgi:hypothetical protein